MTFSDWSWPILFWRFFSALISVMMSHLKFFSYSSLFGWHFSLLYSSAVFLRTLPLVLYSSVFLLSLSVIEILSSTIPSMWMIPSIHRRPTHKLLVYVMIPPRCSWSVTSQGSSPTVGLFYPWDLRILHRTQNTLCSC